MKKILLITVLIWSFKVYSREPIVMDTSFARKPYPESILDAGIGVGPNYGILGVKTVLGHKGSGILFGLGTIAGKLTYEIGLQASHEWFFINIGYGTIGYYKVVSGSRTIEEKHVEGISFILGGKVNLIRSKRLFLEIGLGMAGGSKINLPNGGSGYIGGISGGLGIGYRM